MSQYQKGKTSLDFTEARDSEWQRHQLGHMQVCTSLQTDNHASTPLLSFFTGRMPFLPPNQQRQSTEGKKNKTQNATKKLRRRRNLCEVLSHGLDHSPTPDPQSNGNADSTVEQYPQRSWGSCCELIGRTYGYRPDAHERTNSIAATHRDTDQSTFAEMSKKH